MRRAGIVPDEWDAREAGAALLADVTRAITDERAKAADAHRPLRDSDLARAVLRSPALADSNRKLLDEMLAEYEPKIAARIAAMAAPIAEAAARDERERIVTLLQAHADRERQASDAFPADPGLIGAARAAGVAVLIAKGETGGEGMMP
jgi:hypothetical protein